MDEHVLPSVQARRRASMPSPPALGTGQQSLLPPGPPKGAPPGLSVRPCIGPALFALLGVFSALATPHCASGAHPVDYTGGFHARGHPLGLVHARGGDSRERMRSGDDVTFPFAPPDPEYSFKRLHGNK